MGKGRKKRKSVSGGVDYSEYTKAFAKIPFVTKSANQQKGEELNKACFEILEVTKSADGTKGILVGYANKYNVIDLQGDIMIKGAFADDIGKTFPYLLQHNKWDIDAILGEVKILQEDDIGCKCQITLFLEKDDSGEYIFKNANKAYLLAQKGLLKNSIGAFILQREYKEENGQTVRIITKAKLREVSGTLFPANPESIITTVKNETGGNTMDKKMLQALAQQMGKSIEEVAKMLGYALNGEEVTKIEGGAPAAPDTTSPPAPITKEEGAEMNEVLQKALAMALQNIFSGNTQQPQATQKEDDTINKADVEKMIKGAVEKAGLTLKGGKDDMPEYISKNEEKLKAFGETENGRVKLEGAAFAETSKAFMDPAGATQGTLLTVENRSFLAYVQPKLTMWDVCNVSNDDSMAAEFIIDLWDGDVSEELKPGQDDNELDSNFGIKKVMANRIATHVDVPVNMLRNKNIIELATYLQTKIGAKLKLKANNKFAIGTGDGIDGIQGIFKATDIPVVEIATDLPTLKDINKMVAAIPSRYDDHPMVAIMSKTMLYHLYDLELDNQKPLIRSLGNQTGSIDSLFGKYPIIQDDNAGNEIIFGDINRGYGIHLQIDVEIDRDDKILFTKGLTRIQGRIFVGGRVIDQHGLVKMKKAVVRSAPMNMMVNEGEGAALEDLSVPELKALCKERGLTGYSALDKAELVALLKG
ncbi:MAG: phage major capsid protein [Cellulosilyticaceae bacterium]